MICGHPRGTTARFASLTGTNQTRGLAVSPSDVPEGLRLAEPRRDFQEVWTFLRFNVSVQVKNAFTAAERSLNK
ncbi:transcriptional protein SWT1 [Anopheles sinensis]|uniref:Transcriptional protein SWT1 n=1 Tax=Anopheles sinensis TaxID=74873 RepID=A0A084VRF7_ANOSI|nr:transcriptional protein SWT1 [Anopheles sinensis]